MTFATLRALYAIIGEALDDMEQVYHAHRPDTVASDVEELYGDYDFEPTSRGSPSVPHNDPLAGHNSMRSVGSMTAISKAYVSPPPSPCVATHDQSRPPTTTATQTLLDFPALDSPCDPTSMAELLTVDPKVMAATNRIIAACGQMTATVQTPFLTICDSTMGYHLPSCMRIVEAAHVVEIIRDGGADGLRIDILSERCGIEASKLAHILRLLATHHIFKEISPNVFTTNRISSLIDSGKTPLELYEYQSAGQPELKYQGTNGIAAFVGLCSDEINKASAWMTETYLLSPSASVRRANEPSLAPFCFAFGTAHLGVDYFGWLEGQGVKQVGSDDRCDVSGPQTGNEAFSTDFNAPTASRQQHQSTSADAGGADRKFLNPNRFRLERFGKAMSGTGSWEQPGAVFNAFDWRSLPRGSIVVDVGGGIGSTSMLLASAFSSAEGEDLGLKFIIQDRSVVAEMGEKAWREKCPELLDSGLASFQVHDFFTPQPVRNASVFLLRVVLHDWPDDCARRILLQLREAATPDTKLLLADFVLPLACAETMSSDSGLEGIEGSQTTPPPAPLLPNLGKASANVYWMDMTMNAMFNSKERTLREIVALARSAGWKVVRLTQAPGSLFGHIVAVPISVPGPQYQSRTRTRKESITALLASLGAPSGEQTVKKRLGMTKESGNVVRPPNCNEDPDVDESLPRALPQRCGTPTPTFGSRVDLPSFKEALSRFGGGVKRYRGSGVLSRALGGPNPGTPGGGTSSHTAGKPHDSERATNSTKKRPSPLAVFPVHTLSTRLEAPSPPPPVPPKHESGKGLRKSIKRHVSLANLSRKAPTEPEPAPAVPPLPVLSPQPQSQSHAPSPHHLPTPTTPTDAPSSYPAVFSATPPLRINRHSSQTHLRNSTISTASNISNTLSFVALPSSPDLLPQPQRTSGHYHRHSNSTSSSVPLLPKPKLPRQRCVSTNQLLGQKPSSHGFPSSSTTTTNDGSNNVNGGFFGRPSGSASSMISPGSIGFSPQSATHDGPLLAAGSGKRLTARTGILRFERTRKMSLESRSFSPEIPSSGGGRISFGIPRFMKRSYQS